MKMKLLTVLTILMTIKVMMIFKEQTVVSGMIIVILRIERGHFKSK